MITGKEDACPLGFFVIGGVDGGRGSCRFHIEETDIGGTVGRLNGGSSQQVMFVFVDANVGRDSEGSGGAEGFIVV